MLIPRSRADDAFCFVITVIVVVFAVLALVDLCSGVALIASSLWLALVTISIWTACRNEGGLRRYLINRVGDLAGQRFVEADPADAQPQHIHFGFQLFGCCFIQKSILLTKIETGEWRTGQATGMAGRDMNDWHISIWLDRDDPALTEKQRASLRPDQYIYCVGPSVRKEETEALGLSLVAFLREAGADLIQGETATCFVRQ